MKSQPVVLAFVVLLASGCLDGTSPGRSMPASEAASGSISVVPATPHTARLTSFSSSGIAGAGDRIWDFGDGGSAAGVDVGHVFLLAGTYRVTVSLPGLRASTTISVTDVVKQPDSVLVR